MSNDRISGSAPMLPMGKRRHEVAFRNGRPAFLAVRPGSSVTGNGVAETGGCYAHAQGKGLAIAQAHGQRNIHVPAGIQRMPAVNVALAPGRLNSAFKCDVKD